MRSRHILLILAHLAAATPAISAEYLPTSSPPKEPLREPMPSLDELRGKIVGLLQAPAGKIVGVMNAPAGQLARVFSAYGSLE